MLGGERQERPRRRLGLWGEGAEEEAGSPPGA